VLASAGFLPLLAFLAALIDRLWRAGAARGLVLTALASALMFMTALAVALGVVAVAALISSDSSPQLLRGLHAVAFVLAAPAAPAGVAVFVAMAILSRRDALLPRWPGTVSVLGALANFGALGGILSRTGPLNSGNVALGGITAPLAAWALWVLLAAGWLLGAQS
jgi:hypothetical protein